MHPRPPPPHSLQTDAQYLKSGNWCLVLGGVCVVVGVVGALGSFRCRVVTLDPSCRVGVIEPGRPEGVVELGR